MDTKILLIFGVLFAVVGVVTANIVVIESQNVAIVQSLDLFHSMDEGNLTWPLMIRGTGVESSQSENYSTEIYGIEEGMAKFAPVLQVMPINGVDVILQTYPEPIKEGLNVTPSFLARELRSTKNITLGHMKQINTTLYIIEYEVPRIVEGMGNITGEYIVKFSVDNATTCSISSTYGLPISRNLESFETFLNSIDIIAKSELDISKAWEE